MAVAVAMDGSGQLERAKSLTAMVAERLRRGIMDGGIPLGSLLSEKALAQSFGVSKSPVREALVQLQAIGLVAILPQRGGFVFKPDAEQVRELCEVRLELETAALGYAIERNRHAFADELARIVESMEKSFDLKHPAPYQLLDDAFHNAFFAHCGNSLLARTYETFTPRIGALRTHLSSPQPYLLKRSLEEHRMMVELVRTGDRTTALQLLREHISRTQEFHSRALTGGEVASPQKAKRRPRQSVEPAKAKKTKKK